MPKQNECKGCASYDAALERLRNCSGISCKGGNDMMAPILKWPGTKWRIADWIISAFPEHEVYCEPFFGSGAVFFNKNPSKTETINDIDGNIVNLFRVIRESADDLSRAIEMTPYAREEYYSSYDSTADNVERARRFVVRTWQAFGGKTACRSGWAHDRTNQVFRPKSWSGLPERILQTVSRLRMTQIEHMDALKLIPLYNRKGTLLYIDPPYLASTRTQKHYACEFDRAAQHEELLKLCLAHRGYCIISGYANELYSQMLTGWEKRSIQTSTSRGSATETIYINPACIQQVELFT